MRLDNKEMKLKYEVAPETAETRISVEEAFDVLFEELVKHFQTNPTAHYA